MVTTHRAWAVILGMFIFLGLSSLGYLLGSSAIKKVRVVSTVEYYLSD